MGLVVKWDDIKSTAPKRDKFHTNPDTMVTKRVYGNNGSLAVISRTPGYHSYPHVHHCEQLNYCIDGEVWIFVDTEGLLMKKGDFSRVPSGALHWAWNRSDQPCTLVESHVPQMGFEPERQQNLVGLYAEGEEPKIDGTAHLIFEDDFQEHASKVEEVIFGSAR